MAEGSNSHHQELVQSYLNHAAPSKPLFPTPTQPQEPSSIGGLFIEDPATGKRIYPKDAITSLSRYIDYLNNTDRIPILYELKNSDNGSLLYLISQKDEQIPQALQELAKQVPQGAPMEYCFATCRTLFKQGLLDPRFFVSPPLLTKSDRNDDNVKTANVSTNTRRYSRRRPTFWTRSLESASSQLYPLVVSISSFRDGCHAPMLILSRLPLPRLDSFAVFSNGQKATVQLIPCSPLTASDHQRNLFVAYTTRVARALANKPLEGKTEELLYFFSPLATSWDPSLIKLTSHWQLLDIEPFIAWDQMEETVDHWATPLLPDGQVDISACSNNCVVQDRAVEFTNRHFVTKVRHDLSPLSRPDPESVRLPLVTHDGSSDLQSSLA